MRLWGATARLALATLAVIAMVTACGSADGRTHAATTPHSKVVRVVYGEAKDNFGILHLPAGDGPFPVVVMVHGGGWIQRHDLSYFEPLARDLAAANVAVWNIEYRRVNGAGGWPATLADADNATESLATVVQKAADGRLDLDRVHVAGHSAGGHLAAWIVSRHTLPPGAPGAQPHIHPKSATIMAGVFDLSLAVTHGHDKFVRNLLAGMPSEFPNRYRIASPIDHLPVGIPVTAIHGTADHTVDPMQSRRYVDAAVAAGDPAQLLMLDGVGHGAFGNVHSRAWAVAKNVILKHVAHDAGGA